MSIANKIIDKVEETSGNIQETAGEATDRPEHEVKGIARQTAAKASYAFEDATDYVKERTKDSPFIALAVAASIGFMLARIFGVRR